jgi:ATP-dependent RNA helicase RhlE
MHFNSLNLIDPILKAVEEEGYTTPTPIQQQSIPIVLQGRDLLGCAQTGTGKTAAFAIPMLQLLDKQPITSNPRPIRALILTPTRELAIQIEESFQAYGRHLKLKTTVIFGGVGQQSQVDALRRGIDVLIATPGRMLDLMGQGYISLKQLEIFVLDEADRMLDMGFIHDVKKVLKVIPEKRQSLFFSATMPPQIIQLAGTILSNPASVTVTPVSSTVEIINQSLYFVDKSNKYDLLLNVLDNQDIKTALVFTRTKHGADKVVKVLQKNDIVAEAIHGNKAQNARQRALTNFKAQTTRVLVATDIAARGIDVDELAFVINFELPNIPETYVHRIGRTGRAGAAGTAISFCDQEEKEFLRDIERLIGKKIPVEAENPFEFKGEIPEKEVRGPRPPRNQPKQQKPQQQQREPQQMQQRPTQQRDQQRGQQPARGQNMPQERGPQQQREPQRPQQQQQNMPRPQRPQEQRPDWKALPNQQQQQQRPQNEGKLMDSVVPNQQRNQQPRDQQQRDQPTRDQQRDQQQRPPQQQNAPRPKPREDDFYNARPVSNQNNNQGSGSGDRSFRDVLKLLDHDERKAKQDERLKQQRKDKGGNWGRK